MNIIFHTVFKVMKGMSMELHKAIKYKFLLVNPKYRKSCPIDYCCAYVVKVI